MHQTGFNQSCEADVFSALCIHIDSPISLGAYLRFKYAQLELAKMSIDPLWYCDVSSFKDDYMIVSFLSKWTGLKTGLDLKQEALQKFKTSEDHCLRTNARLRKARYSGHSPELASIFYSAQRKISRLLGPCSIFKIESHFGWGPGATFEFPRKQAQLDRKVAELPITVTREALPLMRNAIENDLHWSYVVLGQFPSGSYSLLSHNFQVVDGCRITTVPKNAKTDRVIAIEPRGNMFLQKGCGGYFRSRLKTVGIDLDDQTLNQQAARRAYTERLATLDMKAASDTVATELVYELFPVDWAILLDTLRSKKAKLSEGWIKLNKFSSMGNGFTFEVESLIFWALTEAAQEFKEIKGRVFIYGDDIICDQMAAECVISTLIEAGFEVNDDKSYTSGRFFESCGEHFFDGENVTPAYHKEIVNDDVSLFRLANRVSRLAFRMGRKTHHDRRLRPAWMACKRRIKKVRYQIPFGDDGDDALLCVARDFDFRHRKIDPSHGIQCDVFSVVGDDLPAMEEALLAWTLRRDQKVVTPDDYRQVNIKAQVPYLGNINIPRVGTYRTSKRWVIPSGEFSSIWQ